MVFLEATRQRRPKYILSIIFLLKKFNLLLKVENRLKKRQDSSERERDIHTIRPPSRPSKTSVSGNRSNFKKRSLKKISFESKLAESLEYFGNCIFSIRIFGFHFNITLWYFLKQILISPRLWNRKRKKPDPENQRRALHWAADKSLSRLSWRCKKFNNWRNFCSTISRPVQRSEIVKSK